MPSDIQLDLNVSIGETQPALIIAEIGQNHQGDISIAKELIKAAKECGANCVKFQKTCLEEKFNKEALNRPYLTVNSWGATYGEHKKYLEFSNQEFLELQNFAKELGILFTASAMDLVSLDFLESIRVPFIKIGSGDANNMILIRAAASKNIPLIISTGMQNFHTVRKIYNTVRKFHEQFVLLHCVSAYPTPIEEVNLSVINLFKREFSDIHVGYSGHEMGIDVSLAAAAMGAKVIERHITFDKNQKGSDHKCSLTPDEFTSLVKRIRNLEAAFGQPIKSIQTSEYACFEKLGKSIVAARKLQKGRKLEIEDLKIKVAIPKGIDGSLLDAVIGKTLKDDVDEDKPIHENCL